MACILQCGGSVEPVTRMFSNKDVRFSRWVGVCRNCGHVQISPLYSPAEQTAINAMWHSHFQGPSSSSNTERKRAQTMTRLASVKHGGRLLDIGAGEGWGKDIADYLGMEYWVVEPFEALQQQLKDAGAKLAGTSIEGLTGTYDLILFRHVFEHLLTPMPDLRKLASHLSTHGTFYIATPDFNSVSGRAGYRTSSLRPVHVSYFTANKLEWALGRAGLSVTSSGVENELWLTATKGEGLKDFVNEFDANKSRLRRLSWSVDNLRKDGMNMIRFAARGLGL
jgi:hypothetical protein